MIAFIFYTGYFGIKHENIFVSISDSKDEHPEEKISAGKYKKSGIREEVASKFYKELLIIMEKEKPYLDPKLSLSDLAGKLNISTNQLSQIINQKALVNFHDFVNGYRVEEFIRQAKTNKNFSLLALALDSGFNSKSSFNYIFKKQKGLSPSQYLSKSYPLEDKS
jgi:AraC-like DNA-binding protein